MSRENLFVQYKQRRGAPVPSICCRSTNEWHVLTQLQLARQNDAEAQALPKPEPHDADRSPSQQLDAAPRASIAC